MVHRINLIVILFLAQISVFAYGQGQVESYGRQVLNKTDEMMKSIQYVSCGSFHYDKNLKICRYSEKFALNTTENCPSGFYNSILECEAANNVEIPKVKSVEVCKDMAIGELNYCLLDFTLSKRQVRLCSELKSLSTDCYEQMGKINKALCNQIQGDTFGKTICLEGYQGLPPHLSVPKGGWKEMDKPNLEIFDKKDIW